MVVDAHGMPVRVLVTAGTVADCTQASRLTEGLNAEHLLADKSYDTEAIVTQAEQQGMGVVIPPGAVLSSASGGECVFAAEALAGYCHPLREEHGFVCGRRSDSVHSDLGQYIVTTLSR